MKRPIIEILYVLTHVHIFTIIAAVRPFSPNLVELPMADINQAIITPQQIATEQSLTAPGGGSDDQNVLQKWLDDPRRYKVLPSGTYLIFSPRKSLAEMDPNPAIGRAVQEALGEDNAKKRRKLFADSVISSETIIYAFSPRMSYVPKEWAKTGGEFWTPKPPPTPRPLAKKPAEGEKAPEKE